MGLHICLLNENGKDHPDWDFLRQGNDKKFPDLFDSVESMEVETGFRPVDFDLLKEKINQTDWYDKERYLHLIKLLEENPDYYIYFSY